MEMHPANTFGKNRKQKCHYLGSPEVLGNFLILPLIQTCGFISLSPRVDGGELIDLAISTSGFLLRVSDFLIVPLQIKRVAHPPSL